MSANAVIRALLAPSIGCLTRHEFLVLVKAIRNGGYDGQILNESYLAGLYDSITRSNASRMAMILSARDVSELSPEESETTSKIEQWISFFRDQGLRPTPAVGISGSNAFKELDDSLLDPNATGIWDPVADWVLSQVGSWKKHSLAANNTAIIVADPDDALKRKADSEYVNAINVGLAVNFD